MRTKNTTIPWLPKSIAVGLQDDLVQYVIELKFLLLFFDKPLAIMSNTGFNFVSPESVEAVKRGQTPRVSAFDEINLLHLEILGTDEWEELMSLCEPIYTETNVTVTNNPPPDGFQKNFKKVDEVFSFISPLGNLSTKELFGKSKKGTDKLFREYFTRIEMSRLIDILQLCQKRRIPMVWGVTSDIVIADLFTKYLIKKHVKEETEDNIQVLLRLLKSSKLLQDVFHLDIVNLATAPVSSIIKFKKSNSDLLQNFLVKYRKFLVEVQNEPTKVDKIARGHIQDIVEEMNTIRQELLLLRQEKKYNWLRRISESAYDGAKIGALAAIWSLLLNPTLLAGALGETLLKAATRHGQDVVSNKEKENALLFRSSSGYLWKAHKEFHG
jgi:hypothetical protein